MSAKTLKEHENVLEAKKKLSLFERLKKKFKFTKSKKTKETSKLTASLLIKSTDTRTCDSESDSSLLCKICLNNFGSNQSISCKLFELSSCKCKFCINCLYEYIKQSIENCNVLPLNCPDSKCKSKGFLCTDEIRTILNGADDDNEPDINNNHATKMCDDDNECDDKVCFIKDEFSLYEKYLNVCQNLEIIRDPHKTYCPKPNCQNICKILAHEPKDLNVKVICDKCDSEFCSKCFKAWSSSTSLNITTETHNELLINDVCDCNLIVSNEIATDNLKNIKRCPNCSVLIERADGCAQVMCKICKHTFCFYCLTSLENDFLLKHYTKNGPCKGKLGHSRISLFFHRLSVIAVFSGTIILLIFLSPFLLFALPCIILNRNIRKHCIKKLSTKFG